MPSPLGDTQLQLDTVIIGGGIAGLWLANRLKNAGFSCILLEHKALGSEQTMASQGMIHGGMKYTLSGALSGASEAIADMPQYWRKCLCGEGDVDLRNTRILSDHFYLWSGDSLGAKLTSFFASKASYGRVDRVDDDHRPPLLRHQEFNGSLYKLTDLVLDVHSLVTNLAQHIEGQSFLIDWSQAQLHKDPEGTISLSIAQQQSTLNIQAKRFIFCAGHGNGELLAQLNIKNPAMQLRPLQQVLVKHQHPYHFFGHCLGHSSTPRLTISSHKLNHHEHVWYLGGSLAEKGATMDSESLIAAAKQELSELIPWVDLSAAQWATLAITRAEALQPQLLRPDNAFAAAVNGSNNLIVAWPTKLTLAPNLANQTLAILQADAVMQGHADEAHSAYQHLQRTLTAPSIAIPPWQIAFPPALSPEDMLELKFAQLQLAAEEEQQERY